MPWSIKTLKERTRLFANSRRGQRWGKGLRAVLTVGIIAWLVYQLSGIGWSEVWTSRPRTPWFYVLWVALYFQLPLVEAGIYRAVWGLPIRAGLIPILRKRALNQDVVSYSGEAYFFTWARQRPGLSTAHVAGTLKDNAIASSLGSWAAAILVVGAFLYAGQITLTDLIGNRSPLYIAFGVGAAAVLAGLGLHFRHTLFTLPARTVAALFAAHFGRFVLLIYGLRILQWWVVLPDVPLSTWATMLAVLTLVNRLPLVPAKDLVGIGAVLGMTSLLSASAATIAAMLLVHSALNKVLNFTLFVGAFLMARRRGAPDGDGSEQAPPPGESPSPVPSTSSTLKETN